MSRKRPPVINFAGVVSLPSARDLADATERADVDQSTLAFRQAAGAQFEATRARRARHTAPARAVLATMSVAADEKRRRQVRRLADAGFSQRQIASTLKIGRNTVARLLRGT